jgi:hypothetical protein
MDPNNSESEVSELEEAWVLALAEAETRARLTGRKDLVDYLALRKSNDLLRTTGVNWLLTTFEVLAGQANRNGASIQIAKDASHRFRVGNATMVGKVLTLGAGVRRLSIEAGWPRTPRDGFVSGGGLACGNIKHLGIKLASESLLLVLSDQGSPLWIKRGLEGETSNSQVAIHEANLRNHIRILLGSR